MDPIRKAASNLLFAAVKSKFGVATKVVPPAAAAQPAEHQPQQQQQQQQAQLAIASAPATGVRINLGQVINQAMAQEIPFLTESEIAVLRERCVKVEGDDPRDQIDASDAQLTALKYLIDQGLTPFAGFGVFLPLGARQERRHNYFINIWTQVDDGTPQSKAAPHALKHGAVVGRSTRLPPLCWG